VDQEFFIGAEAGSLGDPSPPVASSSKVPVEGLGNGGLEDEVPPKF